MSVVMPCPLSITPLIMYCASVCTCVYIHVYMCDLLYVYVHAYMCTLLCMCIVTLLWVCLYTCAFVTYTCVCMYPRVSHLCISVCIHRHSSMYLCMCMWPFYMCVFAHMCIPVTDYMHVCTYLCICMYTCTFLCMRECVYISVPLMYWNVYMCTSLGIYMCGNVYMYIPLYAFGPFMYMCMHICTTLCMHACTLVHIMCTSFMYMYGHTFVSLWHPCAYMYVRACVQACCRWEFKNDCGAENSGLETQKSPTAVTQEACDQSCNRDTPTS